MAGDGEREENVAGGHQDCVVSRASQGQGRTRVVTWQTLQIIILEYSLLSNKVTQNDKVARICLQSNLSMLYGYFGLTCTLSRETKSEVSTVHRKYT